MPSNYWGSISNAGPVTVYTIWFKFGLYGHESFLEPQ